MINVKSFNSLIELAEAFSTEEVCLKYLESLIWEKWCGVTFRSRIKSVRVFQ